MINLFSLSPLPREEKLLCNNGILFYFSRPGGGGVLMNHYIENKDPNILKDLIKSSNLIFEDRLYKYPGRRAALSEGVRRAALSEGVPDP
jgi:hypothetical protein